MTKRTWISFLAAGAMLLPLLSLAQSQEEPEGVRQLWNSQFYQKRPAGKKAAAAPPKTVVYKPVTVAAAAPKPAQATALDTLFGLTLWRLRRPRPADDPNSRLLVIEEESAPSSELVPERIDVETPLAEGDRVRLTVEVPRTGYLYVIDREQYADGTTSVPYLIYPNYKTRQGDNAVAAGRVIEIPDQRDNPPYFRIRRGRPDQVAEVLTMLITNEPLPNLAIGRQPLKISEEQFTGWEKQFGVQAERFELDGGAGATYSGAEKKAGADGETRMTQDDPMPQTLYRVPSGQDKPILLSVPVRIGK
jgi:hypothetical protein